MSTAGKAGLVVGVSLILMVATTGRADVSQFSFTGLSLNNPANVVDGENQLLLEVSDPSPGEVLFQFFNLGPVASFIDNIYLDGPDGMYSFGHLEFDGQVYFEEGTPPPVLGGGNDLTPSFEADLRAGRPSGFDASYGVDPGESVLWYVIQNSGNFDDVLDDLADRDLRIGIKVQGFGNGGVDSDTFINGEVVPTPSAIVLGMLGLGSVGYLRRRNMA